MKEGRGDSCLILPSRSSLLQPPCLTLAHPLGGWGVRCRGGRLTSLESKRILL